MKCKLCGKEIVDKFYLHLNASHRIKKNDYLSKFPEQAEEYKNQISPQWNKGLTEKDHPSIAKYVNAVREYSKSEDVRKKRSEQLKQRYVNGDILTKEQRENVVRSGSDGWVRKLKSMSDEEKRLALYKFTSAGNKAQNDKRDSLTPDDFNRLYPFGKGKARYHNCEFCGKQMIAWFGGKPRPKKRFCNKRCYTDYQMTHPCSSLGNVIRYYSSFMNMEFCLRSKLEVWTAKTLDDNCVPWVTPSFYIPYDYLGKNCRYYPDFFVAGKYLIEVKSDYVRWIQGEDRTRLKIEAAKEYCQRNRYEFFYWQFGKNNIKSIDVESDLRIIDFLLRVI